MKQILKYELQPSYTIHNYNLNNEAGLLNLNNKDELFDLNNPNHLIDK